MILILRNKDNNMSKNFNHHSSKQNIKIKNVDAKISEIGFGTYRIDKTQDDHKLSLKHALINGINLIDTSANYTDGSSEELIGEVIHELSDEEVLSRENLVIVSKGGYIQGKNWIEYQERKKNNNDFFDFSRS